VEFLVDSGGRAFFLEMNTRIQVEHPVTEEVTGIDLVAWQLRIAAGARLRIRQEQVNLAGHAMEARFCAEDPAAAFLPQSGHVRRWRPPAGVRVEHSLREGAEVWIHYDSLLAKVIAKGATREEARQRLCRALADTVLLGVPTNKTFLLRALEHDVFVQGRAATDFLDEWREPAVGASPEALAVAAVLLFRIGCETVSYDRHLMNWSNSAGDRRSVWRLADGTRVASVVLHAHGTSPRLYRATVDGRTFEIELDEIGETVGYTLDGMRRQAAWVLEGDTLFLDLGREVARIEDLTFAPASAAEGAGDGRLAAPLSGVVQTILVARGDVVERGQAVVVVESMKMLHTIASGIAGTVSEILVATGDAVRARQPLAVVVAKEEQGARDA
jgi:geranyl-CoA carboxylase alpha subunit